LDEVAFLSAVELGALMREGQASPVEVCEAAIGRIEALDGELGAFVEVDGDRAVAEAGKIASDDRRLFAGVPIAIHCDTPAAGWTQDYSSELLDGHVATHDAYLVRRLREAGAIIVGVTKSSEFGILPTTEPRYRPPARNPWDPRHSPGGSSGGAGVAVASGMLPLSHGNDGGGSLRIPAACCGLVGLKPSRGRISRGPDVGDSFIVSDGVLSRTVLDTAVALDVLTGYEVGDSSWAPPPEVAFSTAVNRDPGTLRINVVTDNELKIPLTPAHRDAINDTAMTLAQLGHDVEAEHIPFPDAEVLPLFDNLYVANIGLAIAHGQVLAGRSAGPDEIEPLSAAILAKANKASSITFLGSVTLLQQHCRRVVEFWADWDVMVMPVTAARPPLIGEIAGFGDDRNPLDAFERAVEFAPYTGLFNMTGQPAITVPAGVGPDGLPVAVQLVGRPLHEDTLLQVARQLEVARPWPTMAPDLGGEHGRDRQRVDAE
jgi:amidase